MVSAALHCSILLFPFIDKENNAFDHLLADVQMLMGLLNMQLEFARIQV